MDRLCRRRRSIAHTGCQTRHIHPALTKLTRNFFEGCDFLPLALLLNKASTDFCFVWYLYINPNPPRCKPWGVAFCLFCCKLVKEQFTDFFHDTVICPRTSLSITSDRLMPIGSPIRANSSQAKGVRMMFLLFLTSSQSTG
jgi:hypothetical protein